MESLLEQALSDAYTFLGPRDRTIAEVRTYLSGIEVESDLIEETVERLIEQGYLDDARYARCFAEDRRNLDSWGTERILRRLLELGVDSEIAEQASQPEDEEQELGTALELLRKKVRAVPTDARARQKAIEMLMRRGYEWELAYSAVRRFEERAA